MFYKVIKEECSKGIKERYTVGQIIDTSEISKLKNDFSQYYYDISSSKDELIIKYHDLGIFNNEIFIYSINLSKM